MLHEAILPLDFVEGIGLPNVLNPPQEHVRISPPRRHGDCTVLALQYSTGLSYRSDILCTRTRNATLSTSRDRHSLTAQSYCSAIRRQQLSAEAPSATSPGRYRYSYSYL